MDSERKTELRKICNELKGIRKSLEFIAMLEAYREGIPFSEEKEKKKSGSSRSGGNQMQRFLDDWDIE